jgi:hypothetical protein
MVELHYVSTICHLVVQICVVMDCRQSAKGTIRSRSVIVSVQLALLLLNNPSYGFWNYSWLKENHDLYNLFQSSSDSLGNATRLGGLPEEIQDVEAEPDRVRVGVSELVDNRIEEVILT